MLPPDREDSDQPIVVTGDLVEDPKVFDAHCQAAMGSAIEGAPEPIPRTRGRTLPALPAASALTLSLDCRRFARSFSKGRLSADVEAILSVDECSGWTRTTS